MASDSTTIDPDVPAPVTDRLPAAVLVVVPLAAAAVSLAASWRFPVTVGDTAWLTQRVADVGAGRWPLVGMPSTIGRGAVATHHPGPLQFYWLAPFWTLAGFRGIVVGTAAAGAAALGWLGVLVRSLPRSSTLAAVGVQVAAVFGLFTISTEMLADPWNPYAALPWLAVLLAAAVAVWNGRRVGWWALVVAASVVAQLHAGYLPLVAGVAAVVAVRTWRRPEVHRDPGPGAVAYRSGRPAVDPPAGRPRRRKPQPVAAHPCDGRRRGARCGGADRRGGRRSRSGPRDR